LSARKVQPLGHQPRETLEQLIPERRIRIAARPYGVAVELEHLGVIVGPRLKGPRVRMYQPRPAENGARVERLELKRRAFEGRHLDRDFAANDHIEVIGSFAVMKQHTVSFETTA